MVIHPSYYNACDVSCDVFDYVIAVRARRMVRIFLPYLGNRSKSDPCSYELFCLESHILSFPKVLQIPPETPCIYGLVYLAACIELLCLLGINLIISCWNVSVLMILFEVNYLSQHPLSESPSSTPVQKSRQKYCCVNFNVYIFILWMAKKKNSEPNASTYFPNLICLSWHFSSWHKQDILVFSKMSRLAVRPT
jgi:hypothetical protein